MDIKEDKKYNRKLLVEKLTSQERIDKIIEDVFNKMNNSFEENLRRLIVTGYYGTIDLGPFDKIEEETNEV
jgi:hypothetical protein